MTFILDGSKMCSRVEAHEEIAAQLELPSWYGANLDALDDVLSGMHDEIRLTHVADMINALGIYACDLLKVFMESPVDFTAE